MSYTTAAKVLSELKIVSTDFDSDTITNDFIPRSDAKIESRTGKTWSTASSKTDYFDFKGNMYHQNPWTNKGFITGSIPTREGSARFSLKTTPITRLDRVYLLGMDNTFASVQVYNSAAATYADKTEEANTVQGGDDPFYPFASTSVEDDILYLGMDNAFLGVGFNLATLGTVGVLIWEYYNGSSWTELTVTEGVTDADDLLASGGITTWDYPGDFEQTTVNSEEKYWVRLRITTSYTIAPRVNNIFLDQDGVLIDEVNHSEIKWNKDTGDLIFLKSIPATGIKKIRVDYHAGASSIPETVEELSTILSSQEVLTAIMGGSFKEMTSGSVAGKTWNYGEPYTNLRATLIELRKRESMLWNILGTETFFAVC